MDEAKTTTQTDFSGIWQSEYTFFSSSRNAELVNKQYVRILRKSDNTIVIEGIPQLNESYIIARMNVDGRIITGSWQDSFAPGGDYKGVMYHGAAQLILSEDGKSMSGKWVGFGKKLDVKTGPWEIKYLAPTAEGLDKSPRLSKRA